MATYDDELLMAARRLGKRWVGQKGKLPNAQIRRSISPSYYALFHFLIEEAGIRLGGSHNNLRRRRRILARVFTHAGIKAALDKVKGGAADANIADFLSPPGPPAMSVAVPRFVRDTASVFTDAQTKRHQADYDLNVQLSELDARLMHNRVKRAIGRWRGATSPQDKDFKHALCMLMLLKGKLRQES